ncbi:MAG: hypothetical protein DI536_13240 [Archangium gephyra]|uniref:DUF3108 domain-containing protein n=1 Tax=Archangium gephyra TaxID=48 RepID=A0A2W5TPJ0_9BACT|nr:MAG: hypothetical protein DI536_13240 [Archangium gephyra]
MLSLVVVAVLSAPTAVGARWTWTLDDSISAKVTPDDISFRAKPSLGKTTFEVEVHEAGENGWKKLRATALQGAAKGRKWELQNNSGDVELRALTKKIATDVDYEEMVAAREAELNNTMLRVSRLLVQPDPIVTASAGGTCTPEVRAAMLKAVSKAVARTTSQRGEPSDETVGEVTCGKPGHYDVKYTTSDTVGADVKFVMNWKGTVDVPAGALNATLKLTGTIDSTVELQRKKRRITGRMTLNSTVTPKK